MGEPDYLLTNTAAETATRFAGLEETFDPVTIRHLGRVVEPGNRCLGPRRREWVRRSLDRRRRRAERFGAGDRSGRALAGRRGRVPLRGPPARPPDGPDPRGPLGSHPRTPRPRPPADPAGGARSPRRGVGPRWLARDRGLRHRRGPHDRSAEPGHCARRPGGGRVQRAPRGAVARRRASPPMLAVTWRNVVSWTSTRAGTSPSMPAAPGSHACTAPTPARSRPSSSPVASLPTTSIVTSRPSMTRAT